MLYLRVAIVLYALVFIAGCVAICSVGGPGLGAALGVWLVVTYGVVVSAPRKPTRRRHATDRARR